MARKGSDDKPTWLPLVALVLVFLGWSVAYAVTNPPFESPDEPGHLAYAVYVSHTGRVPNQYVSGEIVSQGHHHPLYYFVAATVLKELGADWGYKLRPALNPEGIAAGGSRTDVPRHDPSKPAIAEKDRGVFLVLRLLGCLFGALTVLVVGICARSMLPGGPWWLAPGLVATLPQFQFICASISNDSLSTLLAACAIAATIWGLGGKEPRRWILVGALVGLAILAKKSNLVLVPAALVAAFFAPREGYWKQIGNRLAYTLVPIALLVVPLIARNMSLYGEPLGTRMEETTLAELVVRREWTDPYFVTSFPKVVAGSFVGSFGWMNVDVGHVPRYTFLLSWAALVLLSLGSLWRPKHRAETGFLWLVFVLAVGGLAYYNLTYTQPQGRLLFPALGALALLGAQGASMIKSWRPVGAVLVVAWLLADALAFWANWRFYH